MHLLFQGRNFDYHLQFTLAGPIIWALALRIPNSQSALGFSCSEGLAALQPNRKAPAPSICPHYRQYTYAITTNCWHGPVSHCGEFCSKSEQCCPQF